MSINSDFVLFCKSYAGDILRSARLYRSIVRFNFDQLPTVFSVPSSDVGLFRSSLLEIGHSINIIDDESIYLCSNNGPIETYHELDGRFSQQIIKSEFWRWWCKIKDVSECTYLCLDSDGEFIRGFRKTDFFAADGQPLTVMHDHSELLDAADRRGFRKVRRDFSIECSSIKEVFYRDGLDYSFGPTPTIWSSRVWRDLECNYLQPTQQNLRDALSKRPVELQWYGEALLAFRSIPVHPIPPLFRVYHYDWQFDDAIRAGECLENLRPYYFGVLHQSNWDYGMDAANVKRRKSPASRVIRSLRRQLRRLQSMFTSVLP